MKMTRDPHVNKYKFLIGINGSITDVFLPPPGGAAENVINFHREA